MILKPPYAVPTMEEIRAIPDNGLRVISTFAGGGGSSTGYRMAGFKVLAANEFVEAAAETYRANADPATVILPTDVRELTATDLMAAAGVGIGELDVFDGSPPCSAFSTAGKRSEKWGIEAAYSDGKRQRIDDLFYEYARLLNDIQPKVFVAENVSGLVKGVAKGYFKAILTRLRDCGYRVQAKLLNAAWLGVPQARQRLIFIGVRNDLERDPVFPTPLAYQYTLRDVLPWLTHQGIGGGFGDIGLASTDRPSPTIGSGVSFGNGLAPASAVGTLISSTRSDLGHGQARGIVEHPLDAPAPTVMAHGIAGGHTYQTVIGRSAAVQDRPLGRIIGDTGSRNRSFSHGEIVADGPMTSITTQHHHYFADDPTDEVWQNGVALDPETGQDLLGGFAALKINYPNVRLRKLTLQELRTLCSFPADYVLTGSYVQRWERLGRSVPPVMMRAIATTIRDKILDAGDAPSAA